MTAKETPIISLQLDEVASPQSSQPRFRWSAVCILRRPSGEVIWGRRGADAPFLGGYWVFPGGMLHQADLDWASIRSQERGAEGEDAPSELALRYTALRELSEETGLPLSTLLKYIDQLQDAGQWETHAYIPQRIRAQFFLLTPPDGDDDLTLDQHTPSIQGDGELSNLYWIHPDIALERWAHGEMTIAPPTLALLRALSSEHPLDRSSQQSTELLTLNVVRPHIKLFPVRTPTLPPATHTNVYLLGDRRLTIVDPASPYFKEQARLERWLDEYREGGGVIERVLLTHHHADHIGGVQALCDRYQLPVWAHEETAKRVPFKVDRLLEDGEEIEVSSTRFVALFTPGHAPGHLCFFHPPTGTAIVGDMVAGVGTILVDPYDGDMSAYLKQLSRLRDLHLNCLLPSHGAPIANAKVVLTHYIDHRLERERLIFESLSSFPEWLTLSELVSRAYADAPSVATEGKYGGFAGLSTLAHLLKLRSDGRVFCDHHAPDRQHRWCLTRGPHLASGVERLDRVMTQLRTHCAWDREQTLESLQRYLLEETYEVIDALRDEAEWRPHQGELGDLLLQVIFQSKIREERQEFSFSEVVSALTDKLIRRSPHVFEAQSTEALTADEVHQKWNAIKVAERSKSDTSSGLLASIPSAAPALLRAQLIGDKAATVGFEWPDIQGPLDKVDEEKRELQEAIIAQDRAEMINEVGDLLFAVVNVCRHLGVSPEVALERTNHSFIERFEEMERVAEIEQHPLASRSLESLESLWVNAKKKQRLKRSNFE
jgi:endoribonuclease LACTB2